ncbi:hypothetical protein B0H10DRAFT_1772765, partial [Mycena sp. CBHHK59/15]
SAWIVIKHDGGAFRVVVVNGLTMTSTWTTARRALKLRAPAFPVERFGSADVTSGAIGRVIFSYSTNGSTFTTLGPVYSLNTAWQFFMTHRFAMFNYATTALPVGAQSLSAMTKP